ncbi:hypothetical protein [Raineyella sp. LH-20]|uniref:hypothetical protein n=1 Tax=Raineyella sp. LH-20 TaxID=3081204 RepID=UPI002954AA75|nr:hypothetical protein [Raineyella sp. LH-20]WOP18346.1 hypothetical protein R0146_14125 [Raineyella sp. LH-20]
MIWVLVVVGVAVLGLIGLASYAVWMWHKIQDLLSEVDMVGRQAEEILSLIDEVTPLASEGPGARHEAAPVDVAERVPSGQADLEFDPDFRGFAPRHVIHRH